MRLHHPSFLLMVDNRDNSTFGAATKFTAKLKVWNHEAFGNTFHNKKVLMNRFRGIQPQYVQSEYLDKLELEIGKNMKELILHEEMH